MVWIGQHAWGMLNLMASAVANPVDVANTRDGSPRGYIDPHGLEELWFHTGTACNLSCPFCLEGSVPGDTRLDRVRLEDVAPYMDAAVELGVKQFSFTGGEPFIVRDFIRILAYAASLRPCLVLTNGTDAVLKRLHQIATLKNTAHSISFRVSIDFADEQRHDEGRGTGNFRKSLESIRALSEMGFGVSVARQRETDEQAAQVDADFYTLLAAHGIGEQVRIVSFPDFGVPGENREVPEISEDCMTRHHTAESRAGFMCAFSKMIVKQRGRMRIYACTLVDDDPSYDLGEDLAEALKQRILLHHHRCYSCFAHGASCSEIA